MAVQWDAPRPRLHKPHLLRTFAGNHNGLQTAWPRLGRRLGPGDGGLGGGSQGLFWSKCDIIVPETQVWP